MKGTGYFHVNQRAGWRWSTAKGLFENLPRDRANLTVFTHAQVKKMTIVEGTGDRCRAPS